MKKIVLFVSILAAAFSSVAQQKQLRIEDTGNPAFRPKPMMQLQWRGDSDNFTYIDNNNVVQGDVSNNKTTVLTLDELNTSLKATDNPSALKGFPQMTWKSDNVFTFINHPSLMRYHVDTKKAEILNWWNENAEHYDISSSKHVAYVTKGTLWLSPKGAKKPLEVAKGDGHNILCGMSVHRDEFGISKGTFWSPNGEKLAFYRMDQSMVTDYPMADYRPSTAATSKLIKYPMAGAASHHVTVGIYDVKKKKVKYLETGEPKDQYLTNVTWSPDNHFIYIQVLNRDQNHAKLNMYDSKTGKLIRTILEEKHDKYVEPLHELSFTPFGPTQFIYQSQKDGFNHLYLYNNDGTLYKQLTKGNWSVLDVLGMSKDGRKIYFSATKESPLENHTYQLNLENYEIIKLTNEPGMHNVSVSTSGNYVLDSYSNNNTFYKVVLNDATGKKVQSIIEQPDPFVTNNYDKPEITTFTLKAADGVTDLHARMVKPLNFDPNKKYPVMYYLYGGPHAQMVQNRWMHGADMFMMYMASQGYVVFTMDNRGSGNRGREFEQATFRDLGTAEIADQMQGVNYLKNQPYVDASRMGIFGWSFGGFMTISMMTRQNDVFKAGVAGGPVIDWKFYEVMYTERYMDTPETNKEGYKNSSLLPRVSDLKGKLLVIEGLEDGTVVPQHSYAFINECIAKGVLIDFFPYPNHEHNVRGKDRIHLYKKVEDYFKRNL